MGCLQELRARDAIGAGSLIPDEGPSTAPFLTDKRRRCDSPLGGRIGNRLLRKFVWHDSRRDQYERPPSAPCMSVAPIRLRWCPRSTLAGLHVGIARCPGPCAGDRDLHPVGSASDPRPRCSRQDHDRRLPAGEALPTADVLIRRDRETAAVRVGLAGPFPVAPGPAILARRLSLTVCRRNRLRRGAGAPWPSRILNPPALPGPGSRGRGRFPPSGARHPGSDSAAALLSRHPRGSRTAPPQALGCRETSAPRRPCPDHAR